MRTLEEFTGALLVRHGAAVEERDGRMETVLPAPVADALRLPEFAALAFSPGTEGQLVAHDSELFGRLGLLAAGRGAYSVVRAIPAPIRSGVLDGLVPDRFVLGNAVFRVVERDSKQISYLLACLKYTATSNERQEGLIHALVNEFNLSARRVDTTFFDAIQGIEDGPLSGTERVEPAAVMSVLAAVSTACIREEIKDFVKSLERRLNRDARRVHEYYRTLIAEAEARAAKSPGADVEAVKHKVAAIETELAWKLRDLAAGYKITVRAEPVAFARVETVAPIVWLEIKRRKGVRRYPLTYNPLLKEFDPPTCDSCRSAPRILNVCDDRLHLVCDRCLCACPTCGKDHCTACHPRCCPRCGRKQGPDSGHHDVRG